MALPFKKRYHMLDDSGEFNGLVHTVTEIAKADNEEELLDLLQRARLSISQTHYDNWNDGTYGYTILFGVDVSTFVRLKDNLPTLENGLLDRFGVATRHLENEQVSRIAIVPLAHAITSPTPNPYRPFSTMETKRREDLTRYLDQASEDELINDILLPLFRQLGFHRITAGGHKDKALEYGKDIWMKYQLPTQHILILAFR